MLTIRTDLAAEAHALWRRRAGTAARLPGVTAGETVLEGLPAVHVEVLDQAGADALGKPPGRYHTLDVSALWRREEDAPRRCALAAAALLGPLLPEEGPVLAAGLGNRAMTPDALGPLTASQLRYGGLAAAEYPSYEMDFQPEHIVEQFVRGSESRSTKGSGLGLAIARTYTQSVGGSFHVRIHGDQFTAVVRLPLTERDL